LREIAIVAQTTMPAGTPAAPAPATRGTQDAPFWTSPMMPIFLLIILLYVFMFRTKKGEQNKRKQMIEMMKKGDEVQTIGGEFGRVMEIRDDRILVKVDESSNTKIWYARSAIHRVVGEEKAATK
jgi:preprotein translocase subunit YajC